MKGDIDNVQSARLLVCVTGLDEDKASSTQWRVAWSGRVLMVAWI
jgi:hypothetical protein